MRKTGWQFGFFLTIVFFIFSQTGCSKDKLPRSTGTIINTGTFATGGCEWIIVIGAAQYQPRNLPTSFRVNGLEVELTYRLVQSLAECPNPQNYSGLIHVNNIRTI